MNQGRKIHMDCIKIFAIIMVLFNHTGVSGFWAYRNTAGGLMQILQLTSSVLCKVAVPLFFMCTGGLLLSKDETLEVLWKKRVIRYGIITVLFTFLYYVFLSIRDGGAIDLIWFIRTVYTTSTFSYSGAYWFLYAYIGFLITLPLIRIIVKSLDDKLMMYMFALNILVRGILPITELVLGLGDFAVSMVLITSDVFFYPMLGYYIEQCDFEKISSKKSLLFLLAGAIVSIISSDAITLLCHYRGNITEEYLSVFGLFTVVLIYIATKKGFSKLSISERTSKIISGIGGCTFGVYLIHGIIFTVLDDLLVKNGVVFTYPLSWVRTIVVFLVGTVVVYICKKIPIIKKLF